MTDLELIKYRVSETCRCRSFKKAHDSFCWDCFSALPASMRVNLRAIPGRGYREAFEAAEKFLIAKSDGPVKALAGDINGASLDEVPNARLAGQQRIAAVLTRG